MKKGEKYKIHGYKHNGKLYKTWDEAVLLDETDAVLTKYKKDIENSSYSIHEIMTLASIIELEAGNANINELRSTDLGSLGINLEEFCIKYNKTF